MKLTPDRLASWIAISFCVFCCGCVGVFAFRSLNWPLVNDSAQIHYLCFLMDHGMAPYRNTIEMNMPGTYLYTNAVIHSLGAGALAWRCFDFILMGAITIAMIAIAQPYDWAGGVFGATVFVLYHGRDGAGELGQRDLVIAALLIMAYAFLFYALRKGKPWPMVFFGLCGGMASAIKPLPLPFILLLLLMASVTLRRRHQPILRPVVFAISGLLISAAIVLAFLLREHAVGAFIDTLRDILPYYASLRADFTHLLSISLSPSLRLMALLVLGITVVRRDWHSWEGCALLAGILFGIFSYFAQGKGFVYHRYPMLVFLLLWGGIQFMLALRGPGAVRILGGVGLATGIVLAPLYVAEAIHKHWNEKYISGLTQDLTVLGGEQLSGHVQCLDTTAECDTVLYRMQLVQSTGLIYDFWVFGPDQQKATLISRQRFWQEVQQNPPRLFVVGPDLYPSGPAGYAKLDYWAQFSNYLRTNYDLYNDRAFGKGNYILAYRIYVRKRAATASEAPVKSASESQH